MFNNCTFVSIISWGVMCVCGYARVVCAAETPALTEVYSRQPTLGATLLSTWENYQKLPRRPKVERLSRELWQMLRVDFPVQADWMLQDISHERAKYWFRDIGTPKMVEDLIQAVLREIDTDGGHMVQSMRSWMTLQPGERVSCVGCHESKNTAPMDSGASAHAMRSGPQQLVPCDGPPMMTPYTVGAAKSRLISLLKKRHYDVQLPQKDLDTIARWIDLAVPYCGDYTEANA